MSKVLIAGWFSFEFGHATGGDLLAMDVAIDWVKEAGYDYDIALDPPFKGGINWREVDPVSYVYVVFVCGPFEQGLYEAQFLNYFSGSRLIGLNLSMLVPMDQWKPFDLLYERNSNLEVRPDMVFLSKASRVPIVGICLVEPYPGALDKEVNDAIKRLVASQHIAIVNIDTRLDQNATNLRTPQEIESLIARVDVLVTTRLHGAVMAIKNGVPVVPIDPERGGAKIVLQMQKIGWPIIFIADQLDDYKIQQAFEYCLTNEAREKAKACFDNAKNILEITRVAFLNELKKPKIIEQNYQSRKANSSSEKWITDTLDKSDTSNRENDQRKVLKEGKKLLKRISYWTIPSPFYNWLKVRLK